ncbi:MAG TPA: DNA-processing protein DprA [Thermomicrobiaceae bacterium]|nr:DNA-processing protein DprA [Thermomicrobiaceae bacterium]
MGEQAYWLGFHLVPGIGATRAARLVEHFGTLEAAWHADGVALRAAGLNDRAIDSLAAARQRIALDRELARLDQHGVTIVTLADDEYPRLLREISSPPLVLYVRGDLGSVDRPAVAVVGTRRSSSYGREMARRLSTDLAAAGVTVVSGLARGIDGAAHQAALDAGGRTVAVFGCGLDTIYPPEHRRLAEAVVACGAIVSEFPLGTPPDATNFPVRNRLISGLSLGVIVVEAPRRSGALITANFAADQGRTVYAVPGAVVSPGSEGPLQLLRDGATLVTNGEDVLADLDLVQRQVTQETRQMLPTSREEVAVLERLDGQPRHIDEVALDTGLPVSRLSALLLELQLKGFVRNVGAQHYVRA